jgi:23S rRNA (cytidine1920-2'-O)/16S rRNA (cytidine1409-2'-O)-methyltransferase
MRADQRLVQQGLAPTRSAAQRLIARGAVRWLSPRGWVVPAKAGEDVPEGCTVEVTDDAELRWASRAGLKLDAALARCAIDVAGKACLDVGQSSGGFTDVLLARGAARVVGVDVGHGQLVQRLRDDPRVTAIEGVNVRTLAAAMLPVAAYDLVVADLSFISLALVLPALARLVDPARGEALLLAKPQFELQPADIGKGGLVVEPAAAAPRVEARVREACAANGLAVVDWFESAVPGGDGNTEYFARARPARAGDTP